MKEIADKLVSAREVKREKLITTTAGLIWHSQRICRKIL